MKYEEAIDWLIKSGRGKGRTFLIQYCVLKHALENKGDWIPIFDHEISNIFYNKTEYLNNLENIFLQQFNERDNCAIELNVSHNLNVIRIIDKGEYEND